VRRWRRSANEAAPAPRRPDRGAGLVGSVAGLPVLILLLMLATEVMLGLYATSTVRATLHDAASRAANQGAATPVHLARLAGEAEASLGPMGDRTTITLRLVDDDGDGLGDVVAGEAVAPRPGVVPRSLRRLADAGEVRVGVRVRVERPR
jgi:Flp pilus assembly protein TadG